MYRPNNGKQESHAVAGKPRDAAVNSDRYQVCWHFAGAISAGVLGQLSAQYKSDLHVLSTYLFTGLLTAHYYYNSRCVQCALSQSVRSIHCRLLSFHFVSSFIYLFSRTSQQPARQKQSECETEKNIT